MNGRFLLDTNIIIALFSKDPDIHKKLINASEVFVSSIVLGELYFGANRSSHIQENHDRIDEFAHSTTVLSCDGETARHYGAIKNFLKEKGRPIPENDIWIAAIARQNDLTLVTRDTHFDSIENMKFEVW